MVNCRSSHFLPGLRPARAAVEALIVQPFCAATDFLNAVFLIQDNNLIGRMVESLWAVR